MKKTIALTFAASILFLAGGCTTPAKIKPPADARQFGGKWYRVYPGHCSWKQAQEKCALAGGQLAVIPDEPTQAFIRHLANGTSAWLGATVEKTPGLWQWVDGTPMKYKAWGAKQPDNWGGHENYMQLTRSGVWDDVTEDEKGVASYICEWKK